MLSETITSAKTATSSHGPEGSSPTSPLGNDAAGGSKPASIMMIRIPRSAAASPRASAEAMPAGIRESAVQSPAISSVTAAKATEVPEDRLTSQRSGPSHWSDTAPDGVSANNNKAAPMIEEPSDSPASDSKRHTKGRSMSLLTINSSPHHTNNSGFPSKQLPDQGALESLPKKEGIKCTVSDEDGPALAVELQPEHLLSRDDQGRRPAHQVRTSLLMRSPRHPNAYLGCIAYEPFRFPLANQHPDYGPGATFEVSLPLSLLHRERSSLLCGERPCSAAIRRRCLWGGGPVNEHLYTDDSDPLCMLLHSFEELSRDKSMNDDALEKSPSWLSTHLGPKYVRATFKLFPRRDHYHGVPGSTPLRSRSWRNHSGLSVRLLGIRTAPALVSRKRGQNTMALRAINLGPHEGCSLRFSSHSGGPLLSFGDLLYLPVVTRKRLEAGHSLYLLGQHRQNQYILEQIEEGRRPSDGGKRAGGSNHQPAPRYRLCRKFEITTGSLESNTLFDDLSWEEIGWREGGLSIRSTFLNLTGYHW